MQGIPTIPPTALAEVVRRTEAADLQMASDIASEPLTGTLLRTLAATKPGGNLLELGTCTGVGTTWLLDGMDRTGHLTSVEQDPEMSAIAQQALAEDGRVEFVVDDAEKFLCNYQGPPFDLVFADAQVGKFRLLDEVVDLLAPGAFYIADDLLPQPGWSYMHEGDHRPCVEYYLNRVHNHPRLRPMTMDWSTGLLLAARV